MMAYKQTFSFSETQIFFQDTHTGLAETLKKPGINADKNPAPLSQATCNFLTAFELLFSHLPVAVCQMPLSLEPLLCMLAPIQASACINISIFAQSSSSQCDKYDSTKTEFNRGC